MTLATLFSILLVLFSFYINTTTQTHAYCLPDQRDALIQLKKCFQTTELHSWNASTDCCMWDGIACDEQTGMVTALNLTGRGISGKLHPALFNLTSLRYLNLAHTNFYYSIIPQTGFEQLANLTYLDLSYSGFAGKVPMGFSALTNLITLNLSNYADYGGFYLHDKGLETLLSNLSNLQALRLNGVDISLNGSEWGKAVFQVRTTLRELSMAHCGLRGNLPDELFQLTNLTGLDLSHNPMLPGQLPYSIGNLQYLSILYLYNCSFYGELPPSIANLIKLEELSLRSNRLTVISKGQEMEIKKSLSIFSSLDLSQNGFSGEIPEEIGQLKSLDVLNLSHNALTGPIPSKFANLHQLQSLDLSFNQLSGNIPQELTLLTFLSVLNLSYNDLVGEIPEARQFSTFLSASYLGNPGLCGSPLSMQCATTPSNDGFNKDLPSKSSNDIIGLSISIGLGLGVGFASVIWALVSWDNGREQFNFIVDGFYFRLFHC